MFSFKDISEFLNFQYQRQKLHLRAINHFLVCFSPLSPSLLKKVKQSISRIKCFKRGYMRMREHINSHRAFLRTIHVHKSGIKVTRLRGKVNLDFY